MSQPNLSGPVADECAAVVRGFLEAMTAFERHLLELRPLRPFGYSQYSEQRDDDGTILTGSGGIEDEAEGRPEEDLVRLMQGDDLTDAEKHRVLRVGVFYDDAMERKRRIFDGFWSAMPEAETTWYQHSDPPAYDPVRNRIAVVRQLAPDHVVVLFETECEAGYPADRGYHLRPVSGRWRIHSAVNYREDVCRLVPPPSRPFGENDLAVYFPDADSIARARRMLETLHVDPLVQALEEDGGDLFAALRSVGAEFELDEQGACTLLSLARTAVTDEGMARLAALTDLRELYLGPKITDAGLVHLAGMTRLKVLGFHEGHEHPQVTGSGLVHLAGMGELERLDLGYLPLTDEGMARMAGPAGLRELLVYNTELTDAGLACLATLPNLEELHAHDTMVRGPGLGRLAAPERLRVLDLARTPVDDASLADLTRLTGLVELDLSETRVTDAGLKHLAGLSNLKELTLPDDGVTAQGRAWIAAALPGSQSSGAGEARFPGAACDATFNPKLLALALNDGFRLDHFLGGLVIRVEDAGELALPSGQVVACDPGYLEHPDTWPPFVRAVPPGRYPVRISVVHLDTGAVRVALAALILDPAPPVRFELATRPGEDVATLGPGESFGHGVDSGTSCFLDLQAAREVHDRCERWDRHRQGSQPDLAVSPGRHRTNSVLDPASGLNMILFPSGVGDGRYSSYWGFDAADRLVCLVTDFELLAGGEPYLPRCPECGAGEGELHLKFPCDAERCPFCGEWQCACDCVKTVLGLTDRERELYNTFYDKLWWWQRPKWSNIEERWKEQMARKGRIPFHRSHVQ